MKSAIAYLIVALHLAGCVSTQTASRLEQYAEINALGEENTAMITVMTDSSAGGPEIVEYEGDFVTVGRDSAFWADPSTQTLHAVATRKIRRVRFINRGTGAMEGIGLGVLPGVSALAAIPLVDRSNGWGALILAVAGVVATTGGAFIGATTGALIGHKNDYEFPAR